MLDQQTSTLPTSVTQPGSQPILLTHQAIIWLVIISVIVVSTFAVVIWLLCRCSCTKRRRRNSTAVLDDRNNYSQWNSNAPISDEAFGPSDIQLQPLTKAAVRPAGAAHEQHPGEPVIVDENTTAPAYPNQKNSRYYSGWKDGALRRFSRVSQIGKAY